VDNTLLLLDTPGILWPKFEDPNVGMMLAYTGAVKENVIDQEELAYRLIELLWKYYPQVVRERYKVDMPQDTPGYLLLEEAGRKRGFLLARGEINTERMAKVLLDEYRSGKLGHFTLEMPEEEA
jgi:ribosome biogenesis GTPase A